MNVLSTLEPEKVRGFWNLVEDKLMQYTGNGNGRQVEAAAKSLGEMMEFELEQKNLYLNFMIFNMEQPYRHNLQGWTEYREKLIYQKLFGIWIFDSGTFENEGLVPMKIGGSGDIKEAIGQEAESR